jgi:2-keto-3-deoxy-6-phosphogluconate aldolase
VGVGSALADKQIIAAGDWQRLTQKTEEFLQIVNAARQG